MLCETVEHRLIEGVFTYRSKKVGDERGVFRKYYDQSMSQYIKTPPAECYVSTSISHVVRGLHFQLPPYEQYKIVACLSGSFIDVAVDLRSDSLTYGECNVIEIKAEDEICIYIPPMFAHGILTTDDNTVMLSLSSVGYFPEAEAGIRIDSVGLQLDIKDFVFTSKDRNLPTLDEYLKKHPKT